MIDTKLADQILDSIEHNVQEVHNAAYYQPPQTDRDTKVVNAVLNILSMLKELTKALKETP